MARPALVLLAAIPTLALVGCGGGGGDRLSQAEFVAQADAICKEYEAKLDALPTPQSPDDIATFADRAIPIAEEGRDKLGDLNPPENRQDTYDAWLEQGDESIDIVERLRDAAEDGDQAELQKIAQEAEAVDSESTRLANELGLKDCGGSTTP